MSHFVCELACANVQDDLIFLPSKISSSMGHLGPLVLCTRAMNTLHFMEPNTLRTTQVEV